MNETCKNFYGCKVTWNPNRILTPYARHWHYYHFIVLLVISKGM